MGEWLACPECGTGSSHVPFPPGPSSLLLICRGRKEANDGFTVGSWLVHIPGAVFLPLAPRPYQRPLKQQPVRLWQLASNSSYCNVTVRFPATPVSAVCEHIQYIYWVWLSWCFCGCVCIMAIGAFGFGAFGGVKCGSALGWGKRWIGLYTCTVSAANVHIKHHNG